MGVIISRSRTIPVGLIIAYAAIEKGVFIGAVSRCADYIYPGIVLQAVIGTLGAFAAMLIALTEIQAHSGHRQVRPLDHHADHRLTRFFVLGFFLINIVTGWSVWPSTGIFGLLIRYNERRPRLAEPDSGLRPTSVPRSRLAPREKEYSAPPSASWSPWFGSYIEMIRIISVIHPTSPTDASLPDNQRMTTIDDPEHELRPVVDRCPAPPFGHWAAPAATDALPNSLVACRAADLAAQAAATSASSPRFVRMVLPISSPCSRATLAVCEPEPVATVFGSPSRRRL